MYTHIHIFYIYKHAQTDNQYVWTVSKRDPYFSQGYRAQTKERDFVPGTQKLT